MALNHMMMVVVALLASIIGIYSWPTYVLCGEKAADISFEIGEPIPGRMRGRTGPTTIQSTNRQLSFRNASSGSIMDISRIRAGTSIEVEVPLLPGEQFACEASSSVKTITFDNGCYRDANQSPLTLNIPTRGVPSNTKIQVHCVVSSGPGRGMYATEKVTLTVGR